MMVDRPISVGDFVKLESGQEGFVEEIGWRNTKVRMWANNIVVIPNSKLAQSVVTNYYLPQQEMSVYVGCGVAYESDLEHVERVCIEVGEEVRQTFLGRFDGCSSAFRQTGETRWLADLYQIARLVLDRAGVRQVYGGRYCTFSDPDRFFSYRRDGQTGRMATLIWRA